MNERRPARPGATVAVWILAVLADSLTRSFQTEVFFLLPLAGMLILTIAGVWILIRLLLQRRWGYVLGLIAAWPVIALLPLFDIGDRVWGGISLAQHETRYQAISSRILTLPEAGDYAGETYWIESREPALIYYQRSGFLTDHGGFVYDATDSLPLENANSAIGGIGGYQTCNRLKPAWYRCWFS